MESIILTISIIIGASTPTQLLEMVAQDFRDLNKVQIYLDSIDTDLLTDIEKANYHLYQGYVYDKNNDISRAIVNYRESIRYYQAIEEKANRKITEEHFYYRYHTVHLNIGRLYHLYNHFELAMEHYNKAMSYVPDQYRPRLHYFMALSYDKLGNSEEAIDNLLDAFKLGVEYNVSEYRVKSQIKLGQIFRDNGKYQESLNYLDKVLLEDNLSAELEIQARNTLGITKWQMKDYGAAEYNFKQILDIDQPRNQFIALENLCEMYLEQGFIYKAIEAGTKAEKKYIDQINSPQDAELYTFLSDAYLAVGNDEKALEYSNKFRDYMITYYDQQQAVIDDGDAYRIQVVTENYEKDLKIAEDQKKSLQANILVTSIILITFVSLIWQQQEKKKKMVRRISEELLA